MIWIINEKRLYVVLKFLNKTIQDDLFSNEIIQAIIKECLCNTNERMAIALNFFIIYSLKKRRHLVVYELLLCLENHQIQIVIASLNAIKSILEYFDTQ